MDIHEILHAVEDTIQTQEERAYFLIHEARYKRILEEIERLHPAKVLDVGCFPYHLGKAMELMGYEVYGIASAHEPIENTRIAVLNIEADPFPWKANTFDLVLCTEVIEHLPHSPLPALKEMYRVTKKGGRILITTPNIARSINRGKLLIGLSPMYDIDALLGNEGKGTNLYHRHNREYTLAELELLVGLADWNITRATHVISYSPFRRKNRRDHPLLWTGKFANFLAMAAIPRLRDTLLLIARK